MWVFVWWNKFYGDIIKHCYINNNTYLWNIINWILIWNKGYSYCTLHSSNMKNLEKFWMSLFFIFLKDINLTTFNLYYQSLNIFNSENV